MGTVEDAADRLLAEAVRIATGLPDAKPRPGQVRLLHEIVRAQTNVARVSAAAPTGVGKSLAALSAATAFASIMGERTVISTESIALQAQYVAKDAPVVQKAAEKLGLRVPSVRVMLGWSNYGCHVTTLKTAEQVVAQADPSGSLTDAIDVRLQRIVDTVAADKHVAVDGREFPAAQLAAVCAWVLDDDTSGNRHDYPGVIPDGAWPLLSTSSAECLSADCPMLEVCHPTAARAAAGGADIIITNHALLGVQATKAVPAVFGSKKLGQLDHLIVDEAHALPPAARSQGAFEVGAHRLKSVVRSMRTYIDDLRDAQKKLAPGSDATKAKSQVAAFASAVNGLATDVRDLSAAIDKDLSQRLRAFSKSHASSKGPTSVSTATAPLGDGDDPLSGSAALALDWVSRAKVAFAGVSNQRLLVATSAVAQAKLRVSSRLESLSEDLASARAHRIGQARWLEGPAKGARQEIGKTPKFVVKVAPVDVAPALIGNLYSSVVKGNPDDPVRLGDRIPRARKETLDAASGSMQVRDFHSVSLMSGTLPQTIVRDAGISGRPIQCPSPFDAAYREAALYVPTPSDTATLDRIVPKTGRSYRGAAQRRFSTIGHVPWAAEQIVALVEANGGSALILSATAKAGQNFYVPALRRAARGRWKVLSQWDGLSRDKIRSRWRADIPSVLVGTRSFMTGVDGPGDTCTLVVVDRPPRAAGNPVDDERVAVLMEGGMDDWPARAAVYAGDASLLLEQAAGRLIRSVSDGGLVAVLDPRVSDKFKTVQDRSARPLYQDALRRFPRPWLSRLDDATAFLRARTGAPARKAAS